MRLKQFSHQKKIQFNEATTTKAEMRKISQSEQKRQQKDRMEEDDEYGGQRGGGEGVQCAQQ